MDELRIGTRGSALALAQSADIRRRLQRANPRTRFRLVTIKTLGDEFQSVELFKKSGVGVFTKAIEKKLLSKEIDIAVHSLKDLPTELAEGLVVGAVPKRFPAEDVLITREGHDLRRLPKGARVGTGSPRRKRQLLRLRPDLKVSDLRGNLDSRVAKVLKEKKLDAVVVAKAGLLRLKRFLKHARALTVEEMVPAIGQGALAIQVRKEDKKALAAVRKVNDARTQKETSAERTFLRTLRGGCRVPAGAFARLEKGQLVMDGAVFSTRNEDFVRAGVRVPAARAEQAAENLARTLLKKGGTRFLREARA
jgi:hydroxymethylbilane synthase